MNEELNSNEIFPQGEANEYKSGLTIEERLAICEQKLATVTSGLEQTGRRLSSVEQTARQIGSLFDFRTGRK